MDQTVIKRFLIPHTAFVNAQTQIEQCFDSSADKGEAEGLAIVGETGTGKTSLLRSFKSEHEPFRGANGMTVPVLYAKVPPGPTVKSLAGVMLAALSADDPERGTENEKSWRLRKLMKECQTRLVMMDEFQHFIDRGTQRVIHHVADWLKVLIDDTCSTLIVAGLPYCTGVIDCNEQLARRFLAPIQLPRFDWVDLGQRKQFTAILKAFHLEIAKGYEIPTLFSSDMAFRFYCATGGLIGYMAKILRQSLLNADSKASKARKSGNSDETVGRIELHDLAVAHMQAVWSAERMSELPKPFEESFRLVESVDLLE